MQIGVAISSECSTSRREWPGSLSWSACRDSRTLVWPGAAVTMFAMNPVGITSGYLQIVMDIDWTVPDKAMVQHMMILASSRR
jgi:hypothetical protein